VIDEQDRMRPHVRFFVNGQAVGELSPRLSRLVRAAYNPARRRRGRIPGRAPGNK
jgi:hypothetical protein